MRFWDSILPDRRNTMTKSDEALASFRNGFTCPSAVFSAFSDELGLDSDTAKKIACGFGAGISKTGNICGAVSGAIMVIGLKYGKTTQGDDAATEKTSCLLYTSPSPRDGLLSRMPSS